ncbi:hypothetical protein [Mesorhizobium sp. B2-4-12]|nr:hypothetical protein [Mesorhizobium sp. B2-4-12]
MTIEIRRLFPGDDALVMSVADVFGEPVRPVLAISRNRAIS